ncbi:MAG: 16S rRNA (cytidine(1402)-2'-O)-methyltransferase [Candidatus Cloacimonadales bacterium]|nr:16S rRNA (cytidine(1402)-2'-O)-methyltransferase [Candidatus Cloacimonadales bacterium]
MNEKKKGKLFIVPTPIGNLADMTFRAVEVLKVVKIIGAEDTRTSSKLLKHFCIETPMLSYHKFNERARVEKFLNYLKNGEDVAIISDAGTPGISDPASILISEVLEAGFQVETLSGATAFVPALVSSGLNCERFYFVGFLPDKEKEKQDILQELKTIRSTIIFYESPHRIHKCLNSIYNIFGDRKIVIGRELSKLHETYYRTTLEKILAEPEMITLKGEFVLVVEGATAKEFTDAEIIEFLTADLQQGISKKNAVKNIVETYGLPKNRVYELALKLKSFDVKF